MTRYRQAEEDRLMKTALENGVTIAIVASPLVFRGTHQQHCRSPHRIIPAGRFLGLATNTIPCEHVS